MAASELRGMTKLELRMHSRYLSIHMVARVGDEEYKQYAVLDKDCETGRGKASRANRLSASIKTY